MSITSRMKKLLTWGKFRINLGKSSPVKELPTKTSDLGEKEIKTMEDFKRAIKSAAKLYG